MANELVRLKVDRHRLAWAGGNSSCQRSNFDDSDCDGTGHRSCRQRVRRQLGPTRWQHHWNVGSRTGDERETTGAVKEIVPKLSRVAIIGNSTNPGDAQALRETVLAAGSSEIYLRYLDVLDPKDIESVFRTAAKGRADALLMLGNPILNSHRKQIVDLAAKHRLPATYARPEYVEAGGLIYYGTNYNDLFRRAATYVDKILKGAKPADLPVEQPTKFEFIINLKAAKQIGLTIPPNVLVRADRVIR